jgi:hypothetical protein
MNELVLANRVADWRRLKMLVLDSVSSPITKRVYNLGLDEFFEWFGRATHSKVLFHCSVDANLTTSQA